MHRTHTDQTGELILQHELFVLDANLVESLPPEGPEIMHALVKSLLTTLGMEKLGSFETYPATDLRAPGFSFIQPITTSHISGHYFEKPGEFPHFHMDIYSCKTFPWIEIIPLLDRSLRLSDWSGNCIVRSVTGERSYCEIRGKGTAVFEEICLNKQALLVAPKSKSFSLLRYLKLSRNYLSRNPLLRRQS